MAEIVRCKDCTKYKTKFCAVDIWTTEITIYKVGPDDFCSFGEKKESTPDPKPGFYDLLYEEGGANTT